MALCELLRLLTAKDKKLFVLDTHAGAGGYDLGAQPAQRTGEAEAGIRAACRSAARRHATGGGALSRRRGRLRPQVRPSDGGSGTIPARRGSSARPCGRATASSPASCIRRMRWR